MLPRAVMNSKFRLEQLNFGMPRLARHQFDIYWLNRTVWTRVIDANAVLAVLNRPTSTWQHVAVVDLDSTTCHSPDVCDGRSHVV